MQINRESTLFPANYALNAGGTLLDLSVPRIMGILNVTPDSFFDGGTYGNSEAVVRQAASMLADGAAILDIGGYSTRPGAADITIEEELRRVIPAIRAVRQQHPAAVISVDTFRSEVAREAVGAGATMVNDVSGGTLDRDMFTTVAELKVPYVLMHMRGTPQTMAGLNTYNNLKFELLVWLRERLAMLEGMGVTDVVVDPGFGFAKNIPQNFDLLAHFDLLRMLGRPLMAGLSRKSMIWKTLGSTPAEALNGTTALHALALLKRAALLRVHDVRAAAEAVKLVGMAAKLGSGS